MSEVFGAEYAASYDAVYGTKDYDRECDVLETLFARHAHGPVESLLELGCGTGGHAVRLAARGYRVVGVDRSPGMLERARANAAGADPPPEFREGDIRTLDLGREFDAATMMFAVLSYQLENDDVLAALRAARSHLREGGLLAFDVWFGPAVLRQGPGRREQAVESPRGPLRRVSSGELDVARDRCAVTIELVPEEGPPVVERHLVRYFFPHELELLLRLGGFAPLGLHPFPDLDGPVGEDTWNVLAVARAARES